MKKILVFLISFFIININVFALELNSKNVVLYNLNDDNIIYEENSDEKIQIASLTKIMTAIVAIENIDDIDSYVTLTSNDFKGLDGYVLAGFNIGDKVTYRDLLYGILLPSGAEAALSVANHISGNVNDFVSLMNDKVSSLKLQNTHFDNPIGKDSSNNYSSVSDVAIILKYALKNKTFKEIFTSRTYTTTNKIKLSSTITSKAKILNEDVDYILGSKTGTTSKAGLCLASISELSNINYLLVTCNAPYKGTYPYNLEDAITLYKYYDENYEYKKLIENGQLLNTLKVKKSTIKKLDIISDKKIDVYVKKSVDLEKLEYKYEGEEVIDYTYKIGDKLGKIDVVYEDEVLYTYDVILNQEIKKFPYFLVISSILSVLVLFILIISKGKKNKKRKKNRR